MIVTQDVSVKGLSRQHFIQLQFMLVKTQESGTYYGRKDYFDKRTKDLAIWIENILSATTGTKFQKAKDD